MKAHGNICRRSVLEHSAMKANRVLLSAAPIVLMAGTAISLTGIEHWTASFGKTEAARLMLGRVGIALPYVAAGAIGIIFLFATAGAAGIKAAGWGVTSGAGTV